MISKLATRSKYKSNCYNERTSDIQKITIHHMAGINSAEGCIKSWVVSKRNVSANYVIGKDGEIVSCIPEDYRAWTSSSRENDMQAITIEVSNCKGKPGWEVSDVVMRSLISLCIDICHRYMIEPVFTGDKNGTFTFHYMFAPTECPGGYIKNNIGYIINNVLDGLAEIKQSIPTDEPVTVTEKKVKVTASILNIREGAGSKYKICGRITDKGVYTIIEVKDNWGKLKSGAGWISLKYVKEV